MDLLERNVGWKHLYLRAFYLSGVFAFGGMLPDVILTLFALEACRDRVGAVPGERNEVMWIKWKNTERLESWRGFKRVIFENFFGLFFVIITSSSKFHPPTASPASSDTDWKHTYTMQTIFYT